MVSAIIHTQIYHSPCGDLLLGSWNEYLSLCDWVKKDGHCLVAQRVQRALQATMLSASSDTVTQAIQQLDEYFQCKRKYFDLPIWLVGTPFQKSVWNVLQRIPYGTTISYLQEATLLGNPKAVRAVAGANGANALSIIVPCHRVIGSNNTLTGYAGGLEAKQFLLHLENTSAPSTS